MCKCTAYNYYDYSEFVTFCTYCIVYCVVSHTHKNKYEITRPDDIGFSSDHVGGCCESAKQRLVFFGKRRVYSAEITTSYHIPYMRAMHKGVNNTPHRVVPSIYKSSYPIYTYQKRQNL